MANAPEIGLALGPMTAAHLGSELAYARHCETVPEEVAYLAAESVNGLEDASVRTRAFFVPFAYVLVALAILTLLVSIYLPLAGLGSLV